MEVLLVIFLVLLGLASYGAWRLLRYTCVTLPQKLASRKRMRRLPRGATRYRTVPGADDSWDSSTVPRALTRDHDTRAGVYGEIECVSGLLRVIYEAEQESVTLTPGHIAVVQPQQKHRVALESPTDSFRVHFNRIE